MQQDPFNRLITKHLKHMLCVLLVVSFFSCNNEDTTFVKRLNKSQKNRIACFNKQEEIAYKDTLLVNKSNDTDIRHDPAVTFFKITSCQSCIKEKEGVIHSKIENGVLLLSFKYKMNCSYDEAYLEYIEINDDKLYIFIDYPHLSYISKNEGCGVEEYSITDCNCIFTFTLHCKNAKKIPKRIFVNSKDISIKSLL